MTVFRLKRRNIDISQVIIWGIGFILIALVVLGSISTIMEGRYSSKQWVDFVVFGMAQGAIYALIALGYTMVYGVLGLINFAHGEVFMSGAFSAYFLADFLDDNKLVGGAFVKAERGELSFLESNPIMTLLIIAMFSAIIATIIAVVLERIAYRPLRESPRLVKLITAIGASFFLQYTFRGMFGSGVKVYPQFDILDGKIFGIEKPLIIVFVSALVMLGLLYAFIQGTKTGRAIRAVSEDLDTAALMGVNVDRTIAITFAVGGFMAGIAGVLYALIFSQVNFFMGFVPGIKAFTAAVLGGIGNLPGAALGGFFLGIFESVGPTLILDGLGIPSAHQLKDVIAFTLLVLVLIFRPTGILGERLSSKRV
jgi:branched-chain amino acid transport system permease protein